MTRSFVAAALALCALVLPVSIALSNIALGVLSFAVFLRLWSEGGRAAAALRREPAMAALLLYAAAGLIAARLSDAPAASSHDAIKDLHRLWSLGLFTAALALEPETPLLAALGCSFGAMALFGIGQTAFGGLPSGQLVRAHGFVHPVVFGEQMALALLGGACLLLRPRAGISRGTAAFTALAFAALVLSGTRMALFGAFAGFVLMTLLEPRARRWAPAALLAVAAAAAIWELAPTGGRALSAAFAPHNPNSASTREVLWDAALRMFRDHPLTGTGPGGYRRLFPAYHPDALADQGDWGSAHNLYFHQLAERGLLGGAALLILCATLLARAVRAARRDPGARGLWAAGAVAAFLVMSLSETAFQNEQFGALLLLVWAWGTAALRVPEAVSPSPAYPSACRRTRNP